MRSIPVEELAGLQSRIARINKRAAKQGLNGKLELEVGERKWVNDPRIENEVISAFFKIEMVEVAVSGSAPSFDGWTFLATLTNDNGALVIRNAPGVEGIDRDSVRSGECDHCEKNRRRNNTYLIEKDGERMQVGSSCVKDFFGHSVSLVSFFSDPIEGDYDFGPQGWDIEHVIALALDCIANHGFVRSQEIGATRDLVHKELDMMQPATTDAYPKAKEIVEWISTTTDSGDYIDNLKAVVSAGIVSKRNLGLAVSAPVAYAKAMEKAAVKEIAEVLNPAIEGKIEVTGTVLTVRAQESDWGMTWKMLVMDDRKFKVWVSVPAAISDVGVGDRVTFVATLTRSDRDETFAFGKRPSKASMVAAEQIQQAS